MRTMKCTLSIGSDAYLFPFELSTFAVSTFALVLMGRFGRLLNSISSICICASTSSNLILSKKYFRLKRTETPKTVDIVRGKLFDLGEDRQKEAVYFGSAAQETIAWRTEHACLRLAMMITMNMRNARTRASLLYGW